MGENQDIMSVLHLDKIVFDKIEFKRLGFSSENKLELKIQSNIARRQISEAYRVNLILQGTKPEEYFFEISLSGFFTFDCNDKIDDSQKNLLITQNAVSILMPYMRSEVSLLTAQPGMECVVLPVFNINKMIEDDK